MNTNSPVGVVVIARHGDREGKLPLVPSSAPAEANFADPHFFHFLSVLSRVTRLST